ncbi:hypothetical protein OA253_02205 [Alphaproteobacteria bacterium]|nr:hypothetical protein [Alphaproteobacteria bacterium]
MLFLFYIKILSYNPLSSAAGSWFDGSLAMDNELQWIFATELIKDERDIISPLALTWLSSDRPPLLTALTLPYLIRPITYQVGEMLNITNLWLSMIYFYIIALIFHSITMLALFQLKNLLKISLSKIQISLIFFSTPFFLINFHYSWPKMLACAFLLIALKALIDKEFKIIGIASCLALMSHGSAIFMIMPIVLYEIKNLKIHIRNLITYISIILPWIIYQKFIDPPGDRLLKYQLAGEHNIVGTSFLDTLIKSYSNLSLNQFFLNKFNNILHLTIGNKFDYPPSVTLGLAQFFHVIPSLMILILFFSFLFCIKKRKFIVDNVFILCITLVSFTLLMSIIFQFGGYDSVSSGVIIPFSVHFLLAAYMISIIKTNLEFYILIFLNLINLFFTTNLFYNWVNLDNQLDFNFGCISFLIVSIYWCVYIKKQDVNQSKVFIK